LLNDFILGFINRYSFCKIVTKRNKIRCLTFESSQNILCISKISSKLWGIVEFLCNKSYKIKNSLIQKIFILFKYLTFLNKFKIKCQKTFIMSLKHKIISIKQHAKHFKVMIKMFFYNLIFAFIYLSL